MLVGAFLLQSLFCPCHLYSSKQRNRFLKALVKAIFFKEKVYNREEVYYLYCHLPVEGNNVV